MAYMYPCIREKVNAPTAEQLVYDELKKLPNDYIAPPAYFSPDKNGGRRYIRGRDAVRAFQKRNCPLLRTYKS